MSRSPNRKPVNWPAVAVVAALGGVVALGLAAQGLPPSHWLAAVAFGLGLLLWAALWRSTWRRIDAAVRPPTWGQRVWEAVVFFASLVALGAIVCWYFADRAGRTP